MKPTILQSGRTVACACCRARLVIQKQLGMVALSRAVQAFSEAHRGCEPKRGAK